MNRNWIRSLLLFMLLASSLLLTSGCSIIGALYEEGQRRLEEQENVETTTVTKADEEATGEEILAYLHEKYNEDFEIIDLTFQPNTSDFIADVSLKSDPVVKFIAFRNMELDTIGDNYFSVYWDKDIRQEFRVLMERLYPNNPRNEDFRAVFNYTSEFREETISKGETYPTYEELIQEYSDGFKMAAIIYVVEPITTIEDKQRQIEKVYEILQHYKNKGIRFNSFRARYYDSVRQDISSHALNIVGEKDFNKIFEVEDIKQFWKDNKPIEGE